MYNVMDYSQRWREHDYTTRIPTELFVEFFRPLSFDDLLAASQVSRPWRATALQFAHLWSDIRLDRRISDPASLLDAVLPRSGDLLISLEYIDGAQASSARLAEIIAAYMPRIMRLVWAGPIACLTPGACPAMPNLVRLSATLPPDAADCESLPLLFDVFPRLEHLSLYGLSTRTCPLLPAHAVPRSLVRLDVQTNDTACDPIPLLAVWRNLSQLRTVCFVFVLPFQGHPFGANIAPLLLGAVDLSVEHAYRSTNARFVVRNEAGFQTSVEYHWSSGQERRPPTHWLVKMLCRKGPAFNRTLRSLRIPLQALDAFHAQLGRPALPFLTTLCIVIRCVHWGRISFLRIPWGSLGCIRQLQRHALDSLTFEFVDLPSRAEELGRFLSLILTVCRPHPGVPLLQIFVRGFPAEWLRRGDVPEVTGLSVTFVE